MHMSTGLHAGHIALMRQPMTMGRCSQKDCLNDAHVHGDMSLFHRLCRLHVSCLWYSARHLLYPKKALPHLSSAPQNIAASRFRFHFRFRFQFYKTKARVVQCSHADHSKTCMQQTELWKGTGIIAIELRAPLAVLPPLTPPLLP